MKTFEHRILYSIDRGDSLVEQLDQLSREGWRAVGFSFTIGRDGYCQALMEREIPEPKEKISSGELQEVAVALAGGSDSDD